MSIVTFLYKLNNLDLQPIVRKLMSKSDGSGWTFQQTEVAIARYKMFLHLNFLFPDTPLVPTKEIDQVWHAHILADTKRYSHDCDNLFGYFLHHSSDEMQCQNQDTAFALTQALFDKFFGVAILEDIQAAPCVSLPVSACATLPFALQPSNTQDYLTKSAFL
ncbi:MAG: glycine-rich domain-containing protein-like [Cyanomargarita calcarea GSE-NOS-MK-12-04C]|jgi:hypothetical protein|uniref:Glycine-rich domain-containing protein-like n=1 Tax=Cyanomargarita calcarea GSE-NOS-MK-12-04C TaxID=2839659 RepID=A0A951QJ33_9CYAN|nr:glycine-rich domain-containing protein-like [Cyanomargarita calcarea GSE-NOS-MK-12-04C]